MIPILTPGKTRFRSTAEQAGWRQEDREVVGGVLALLEAPQPVAAAKGLVAMALLTRASPRFLAQALRVRLLPQVRLA